MYFDTYLNTIELAECNEVACGFIWVKSESPTTCPECGSSDITAYYNLTEDDGSTTPSFLTAFGKPPYSIVRVFTDKEVDLIYSIGEPKSNPLMQIDLTPWGYKEHVPITTFCIDKPGITGEKLKWKAERELRLICEEKPHGSVRQLTNRTDNDQIIGGTRVFSTKWIMNYRRKKIV